MPYGKVFFRWHKCVLGDKAFENSRSLTEPEREKNSYSRLQRTASVVNSLLTETSWSWSITFFSLFTCASYLGLPNGPLSVKGKLNRWFSRDVMAAILGSLSNNDGDGQENVSFKVCSCWFKLYRVYSISLYSSDVGESFWSWVLKDCIRVQEKKKRVVVLCSHLQFHVVVVQRRQRNV